MADDKVVGFPVKSWQRQRNRMGVRAVLCEVSERWIQFPEGSQPLTDVNVMWVDVMTKSEEGKTRKLCTLCISKEDIAKAIAKVA